MYNDSSMYLIIVIANLTLKLSNVMISNFRLQFCTYTFTCKFDDTIYNTISDLFSVEAVGYNVGADYVGGATNAASYIMCPDSTIFGFLYCSIFATNDSTCASTDNYLSVECRTCKSLYFIYLSIYPSIYPSIHPSIHLSTIIVSSAPSCYNGQTRLADNYTTSDGVYEYINGTVEVCVDGQYVPICGHSDYGIEANITDDIGTSVCYSIGYYGEYIDSICVIHCIML